MLIYDPVERITTESALNHPYFDNIDKSKFAERDYWLKLMILEQDLKIDDNDKFYVLFCFTNWLINL